MRASERRDRLSAALLIPVLALAACTGDAGEQTTSTSAGETTTSEQVAAPPIVDRPAFRVGLVAPIATDNWWAALETPNESSDRAYLTNMKPSLFASTHPAFLYVPDLAATEAPVAATQEGERWVVQQPIREDMVWSDGEPVTAHNLAFYFNTVREFGMASTHASFFPGPILSVTAPEDFTVRIEFANEPGIAIWQNGIAFAPFVPAHFWEEHVAAARSAGEEAAAAVSRERAAAEIVAASRADADSGNDLDLGEVTAEHLAAYRADFAAAAGRAFLIGVESPEEPSAGPVVFDRWERGDFAVTVANESYYDSGTEHTLYDDGSYRITSEARGDHVYGGEGSGEVVASYVEGPHVSEVVWVEHPDREEAYQSLVDGEVDFVYDSVGVDSGIQDMLAANADLEFSTNQTDRFRYLAFNLRKPPTGDPAFREAVGILIDKEAVAQSVLGATVFPSYTVVHPDLPLWHNPNVNMPGWMDGEPMSEAERFTAAIQRLKDAGYTWESEPVIDPEGQDPVQEPGLGLTMPDGNPLPELEILMTSIEHDPYRATFGLWIAQWLNDLGVPASATPVEFAAVVSRVFDPPSPEEADAWDLYILGWAGADPSLPGQLMVQLFHSTGDSATTTGLNSTGFVDLEFDAAADAFLSAVTVEEAQKWTFEMERIVQERLPYVILFRLPITEAFHQRVQFPVESIRGGHGGFPNAWPGSVRVSD